MILGSADQKSGAKVKIMNSRLEVGQRVMMFPIRCFTCGALIADKWEEYARRVEEGEPPGKVLDDLGIKRYCCRRMFLSHYEYFDEVIRLHSLYGSKQSLRGEENESQDREA